MIYGRIYSTHSTLDSKDFTKDIITVSRTFSTDVEKGRAIERKVVTLVYINISIMTANSKKKGCQRICSSDLKQ